MKPIRVQGSFVTDGEIEKIIDFLKSGTEAVYDSDIIDSIEREAEHCGEKKKGRGGSDEGGSDEYDADDEASMTANNTSSFNYRKVANSSKMSKHSQGLAIDINPRINPYITKYGIAPANSQVYRNRNVATCRGKYRDYMIHRGDEVYRIFKKNGFSWCGDWKYSKDYQHFER